MAAHELSLDSEAGALSATMIDAPGATHALLLAHGAGADHRHSHMDALAEAFAVEGISTLRFNFPFKQQGRNRVDSKAVSVDCIATAADWLQQHSDLPLLLGGHSFGGRMATHAVAEGRVDCEALILCSFPLHPAGKPSTDRAQHLKQLTQPVLFLSGTRDKLATRTLLDEEVKTLGKRATVHWLDTGDHSFKILKRSRQSSIDIYTEAATAARTFLDA